MSNEIQVISEHDSNVVDVNISEPHSLVEIKRQVNLIQQIMKDVMQEGQHYGVIPGCGKKACLLKPGAEKISLTFKLRPVIGNGDIIIGNLPNGHKEYTVHCHILNYTGVEMATGIGSCSTMEKKFRYRKNYTTQKQEENPDIADVYNTVLKMAKKRAYVDGILSATAASDIFTQDLEDMDMGYKQSPIEAKRPNPAPAPQKPVEQPVSSPKTQETPVNNGLDAFRRDNKVDQEGFMAIEDAVQVTSDDMTPELKEGQRVCEGILTKHFPPTGKGPHSFSINRQYYKTFDKNIAELLEKMVGQVVKLIYTTSEYNSKEQYTIEELI